MSDEDLRREAVRVLEDMPPSASTAGHKILARGVLALLVDRDRLAAERDVFNSCQDERDMGNGPCGVCRLCLREDRDRLAAEVARLGQMESDAYDAIFYAVPEACGEDGKELSVPEKIGRLVEENARLRAAMTDLLPGYEQYLEWCVARGVMFVSEGRKILADVNAGSDPVPHTSEPPHRPGVRSPTATD